jgi:hypothetical protein
MAFKKIEKTDYSDHLISKLPNRPNSSPGNFGGGGLTAQQLRAAYDAMPKFIIEKLNALIDYINGQEELSLPSDLAEVIADEIQTGINEIKTLSDLFKSIENGLLSKVLRVDGQDKTLSEVCADIIKSIPNAVEIVQGVGDREDAVMSQKAVTKALASAGGGGGGGGAATGSIVVTNKTGWLAKTIAYGASCEIKLTWSSIEDGISTGNGSLRVSVNGSTKVSREVAQGNVSVDVGKYLIAGENKVDVTVTDIYGGTKTLAFTINSVSVRISSYFNDKTAYTGAIPFSYTPVGAIEKTMHYLVDGKEIGTETVTASGNEQTYSIPAQSHGSHTLEVYFTGSVDGQAVESNHLFYDIICTVSGNTTPIITTTFRSGSIKQYGTAAIQYIVYSPSTLNSSITLKDGNTTVAELTVDRSRQTWSYKARETGTRNLSIVCGDTVKPITLSVSANDFSVEAETSNLELFLSSAGRSNNEANPLSWSYGDVHASLTGFNLKSDGWLTDVNGNTILRVSGDARVEIPFNIFASDSDFRTTGKTIEIEFATRDVRNYDATILSSWSGERGIKITAQKALLKSEQSEIFTQYKEDETVRVAFTVEKSAENRLLAIYINGIMSGVVQYSDDDDFSQMSPVGITIGSSDCTIDLYCIRVYGNNLTRYQILNNWIADTQDIGLLTERYERNNIFDDYSNITISKLPKTLPYLVVNAAKYEDLPQSKGDKKTVSGSYVDPLYPERSFTFEGAEIDVQGTSSQYYSRKNYKIKFKGGFVVNGKEQDTYQLRPTSLPTDTFTFKADVASSEGANNVELVMLYEDTCPVKTPPQKNDDRVRQGIEGYPCVAFYYDGTNHNFLGKYNFNNDKATEEVFGFKSGDESWEILQNNTDMVIWKDDNFEGDAWKISFEGRYPDKNTDTTRLAAFSSWLKSTDTTAVNTEAEKAERLKTFKDEFAEWCNVEAMLFNYIFTELFLMVDNRAKNAFPTRYSEDGKWLILPYDYDTAMGINNEGELKFGYELEDTDLINGNNVFNGQDSVLYVNMRLAFSDEIKKMYQTLRTEDVLSYGEVERRFEAHQSVWGEAIFNEDARFKYIEPLINDTDDTYLPMLQGAKAEQRKWWLYNRFRYIDSKYNAGDAREDYISLRSYGVADITVTPYADIYAAIGYDTSVDERLVKKRALRGSSVTLENPLSGGRDAVIAIYSASQLSSVGDLSPLKPGMANFSKGIRLTSLKVGSDAEGYTNPNLTSLTVGNLTLLKELDARNCTSLTQAVNLSGCTNIERVYFDGSSVTGVTLPNGGSLKTLHLPGTITNLTILNQKNLTEFVLPSYANISTLCIENTPNVDVGAIVSGMADNSRVRLIGFDYTANSTDALHSFFDKLDTCRGLDENGINLDKAVVSGTVHVDVASATDLAEFAERYPNVTIDYETIGYTAIFMNDDVVFSRQVYAVGAQIKAPTTGTPTRESTAQYNYSFNGWSLNGSFVVDGFGTMGEADVTYYALYNSEVREYTVRFLNGATVLQTSKVAYGATPSYTGTTPTMEGKDFGGWSPAIAPVVGDTDYSAVFVAISVTRMLLKGTITEYSSDTLINVGRSAFDKCSALTSVSLPSVTSVAVLGFYGCNKLISVNLPLVGRIDNSAFSSCSSLQIVRLPSAPPTLGSSVFEFVPTSCKFYIPTGSLGSYQADANWSALTSKYSFVEEER